MLQVFILCLFSQWTVTMIFQSVPAPVCKWPPSAVRTKTTIMSLCSIASFRRRCARIHPTSQPASATPRLLLGTRAAPSCDNPRDLRHSCRDSWPDPAGHTSALMNSGVKRRKKAAGVPPSVDSFINAVHAISATRRLATANRSRVLTRGRPYNNFSRILFDLSCKIWLLLLIMRAR